MELVNSTPASARLIVTDVDESGERIGFLVAKTTHDFGPGFTALNRQSPYPIFSSDVDTDLGVLPQDTVVRHDPAFEVIVLGVACAPGSEPVTELTVAVEICGARRELKATGDRVWRPDNSISPPTPFLRMPLTWDRAFGGSCLVEIDDGAFLELSHDLNPAGRGFDLRPRVEATARWLRVPDGYPRCNPDLRLPNVERVGGEIRARGDDSFPQCWATLTRGTPMSILRAAWRQEAEAAESADLAVTEALHRAPAEMVFPGFERGMVSLEGLSPGEPVSFPFPEDRLDMDYEVANRRGTLPLAVHGCVLLPDERRMYVVHRASFRMGRDESGEARLRVR